jgi:hypothetical protein
MLRQLSDRRDQGASSGVMITSDFVVAYREAGQFVEQSLAQVRGFQWFAGNWTFDRRPRAAVLQVLVEAAATEQMQTFRFKQKVRVAQLSAKSASMHVIHSTLNALLIEAHRFGSCQNTFVIKLQVIAIRSRRFGLSTCKSFVREKRRQVRLFDCSSSYANT